MEVEEGSTQLEEGKEKDQPVEVGTDKGREATEESQNELKRLQSKVDENDKQVRELIHDDMKGTVHGLANENEELKSQLEKVKNELSAQRQKFSAKEIELSNVQEELYKATKNIEDKDTKLKHAQEALKKSTSAKTALETQLTQKNAELEKLKQEKGTPNDQVIEVQEELYKSKAEKRGIENQLEKVKNELSVKVTELSGAQGQLEEKDTELTKKDELVKQLHHGNLLRNRSICIAIGITVGSVVGTTLKCATRLHILAIVSVAVVSALAVGGIVYVVSKPYIL